jgi:transcriptional regulator with XRE-family HTH domain
MLDRIKKIIRHEGLNAGSFADEIGVQKSSMSHILNGRNNPSLDFVIKTLTRFPDINPQWLLLGKGEMYSNNAAEAPTASRQASGQDLFSTFDMESDNNEEVKETEIKPKEPENEKVALPKEEKYVSQILIFFSDSTYQVYKPEKSG